MKKQESPTTIYGVLNRFPTEKACMKYLARLRWPNGFECPRCKHTKAYRLPKRRLMQCKKCNYQVSVTAGTVMHKTRTPLRKWFLAAYLMSQHKQGISAMQLKKDLGLKSYETAWLICQKLRAGLAEKQEFPLRLEVEVDETFVGGREEGVRGRKIEKKSLVAVAVEDRGQHAGSVRMQIIERANGEELEKFVEEKVEPGSTIKTDGWKGYNGLSQNGFVHQAKSKKHAKVDKEQLLPWIHTIVANLKSWLRGTFHGVSKKHLQMYLNEFCYRTNRRFAEHNLFFWFLRRAMHTQHVGYSNLVVSEVTG